MVLFMSSSISSLKNSTLSFAQQGTDPRFSNFSLFFILGCTWNNYKPIL